MGWLSGLPRLLAPAALLAASLAMAAAPAAPPAKSNATPAAKAVPASAGSGTQTAPKAAPNSTASKSKRTNGGTKVAPKAKPKQKPGEVLYVDWRDLLPENERAHYSASAPPPEHGPLGEGGPPAVQKLTTTFNEDLNDMVVRLPGFVVPIGPPRAGLITEFFLVPYIGACIHVPPPPPNQMVYVKSTAGIPADAIHEAYWVTGKMRVESRTTDLGTAAYALAATAVDRYEY
ncbi:MAG TPA: DUF3299 domain-containing protein [Steroidobacteraceae bacterium]|jgi:hypothetical protein|nr:DUF3299 domain-containing protein [Steroidobacteraceae bacterium]